MLGMSATVPRVNIAGLSVQTHRRLKGLGTPGSGRTINGLPPNIVGTLKIMVFAVRVKRFCRENEDFNALGEEL
jgi:hypothetical protein